MESYEKLKELFSGSSADRLTGRLKEMIISGELPAGHVFPNEVEFCEELGIGRSTLREAYKALEISGYITRSKRGTRVNTQEKIAAAVPFGGLIETADYRDVMEFRIVFESEVARLAAERADARDIEQLEACIERMRQAVGDMEVFAKADTEFHLRAAEASKNQFMYRIAEISQNAYNKMLYTALRVGTQTYEGAILGHERICKAIAEKDGDSAERIMRESLSRNEEQFVRQAQEK